MSLDRSGGYALTYCALLPFVTVPPCSLPLSQTVVDLSKPRIDAWNSDALPIYEPGLDEVVKSARGINLFFSTEIEKEIEAADIIFVAVNTPTKTAGIGKGSAANVKNLELAARTIARVKSGPCIVVEKSTVPVMTAQTIARVLQANSKGPSTAGSKFQVR